MNRRSLVGVSTLLLTFGAVSLEACSDRFTSGELIGSYALNVGVGSDILVLRADGSFLHSYQDSSLPRIELGGKWELDNVADGQVVSLEGFTDLPTKSAQESGYYVLRPTRFFGSIRLMRNFDLNEFYRKR
jgi:hypothetical protein